VSIELAIRDPRIALEPELIARLVSLVEHGEGRALPVSISIVDDAEIHRVNKQFLDHDEPTDVIAFDLGDAHGGGVAGEVVVSAECAERVAKELGHGARYELAFYVCHGLLHLCGWEDADPESRDRMHARQEEYLARLGVELSR